MATRLSSLVSRDDARLKSAELSRRRAHLSSVDQWTLRHDDIRIQRNEEYGMAKTVTVRLEDGIYDLIRRAADGERRSISNFLEYAALRYLTDELTVSEEEMQEILADEDLAESLRRGMADAEAGRYRIAE
jgi:uncharacterized protein (DUF1778 family)